MFISIKIHILFVFSWAITLERGRVGWCCGGGVFAVRKVARRTHPCPSQEGNPALLAG